MKRKAVYFLLALLVMGCSSKYHRFVKDYTFRSADGKPGYDNLDYWAAHPWKHNTSDSVPSPLQNDYHKDSAVDIFFLYPTTYTEKDKPLGWNAPIDDATINAKTDYTTILYQASVFNASGRVFSPRYRQANLEAYFPISAEDTTKAIAAFEEAYQDIRTAFIYYLEHWNGGRPIIIASHSQGTTHAKRLLKEFFDGKPLQKKLVAAYLVGIPVEPGYFTTIQPCADPKQTQCFCSWRTLKDGYKTDYMKEEKYTAIVTNPLTWDISKPNADRSQNKGSILLNFNKLVSGVADAKDGNGVIWTRKPKFFGNIFLSGKNYHVADYNLYYLSVRENVQQRFNMWLRE